MHTRDVTSVLTRLFAELVDGTSGEPGPFVLNSGDVGLLRSLDKLSAADASRAVNDGATIAAHVQHVRYGLSLMNRWVADAGDPFADPKWDEAWKTSAVSTAEWMEIRNGFADETRRWAAALNLARDVSEVKLMALVGSIVHLAYHLGAIRQIARQTRGPKEGTF